MPVKVNAYAGQVSPSLRWFSLKITNLGWHSIISQYPNPNFLKTGATKKRAIIHKNLCQNT
jgi:hypothetical protein